MRRVRRMRSPSLGAALGCDSAVVLTGIGSRLARYDSDAVTQSQASDPTLFIWAAVQKAHGSPMPRTFTVSGRSVGAETSLGIFVVLWIADHRLSPLLPRQKRQPSRLLGQPVKLGFLFSAELMFQP